MALLVSTLQYTCTIVYHIIFPAFTIAIAASLTLLEASYVATGRPMYRVLFQFWQKIFAMAFGLGVLSGVVMALQFGASWDELWKM